MILLDTTVLVYAVGAEHPLRASCRGLLADIRDGGVRATTTVEVIQEFTQVRARRSSRREAAGQALEYAAGLSPLLRPDEDDLSAALALLASSVELGVFDSLLAVAARRRRWGLASADRAFGEVDGLSHLDPASPTFLEGSRALG